MVQMKKLVRENNFQADIGSVKLRESIQGEEKSAGIVVGNFSIKSKQ